ncbi:MAG: hypothetical protein HOL80_01040 [Candidatus Magasanikbacteria bacterium]|jgi:hypothetical protein|nr:hypothetical protein [Candidatus Magasanikbacteria bacterium]MBT5262466.1 hypothetical protein [Candidatus Magasanikbacteria bacterium]MBT5820461.1 hypothetical protein [Candidatus Magasanikbacteria bacterium]MBT6294435.1 hypothetical protein [Candidatus Magasanikbacteria bacterium]
MGTLYIGLFGTCGNSQWRTPFMSHYNQEGIQFFNPQVEDWKPEDAVIEAEHLANDQVVLFPITGETYGTGSLAETGFSVLNAIRLEDRRDFVIMIEQELDDNLEDAVARKESLRARALVKEHLKKLRLSNLYVVDSLQEMLEVSVTLYRAAEMRAPLGKYNPHT